ncbi:MAG: hypothetical protein HC877_23270 [Thioploca sp.]|nr:hypothetical protein [Thioploca sp.]
MRRADINLLKTASNNLRNASILDTAIILNNIKIWYKTHPEKIVVAHQVNNLITICDDMRNAIKNLDFQKLNKKRGEFILAMDGFSFENIESKPTKIIKKAILRDKLPETSITIIPIGGERFERIRYAKILGSALRIELDAECCSIHAQDGHVELQADILGSSHNVKDAATIIADGISDAFENLQKSI